MGLPGSIPDGKEALKEYRKVRYQEICKRLGEGAEGWQIIASITGLADEIIEHLYRGTVQSTPSNLRWRLEDRFSIVALGGYGRGELAPFSDIDLMFLYRDSIIEIHQAKAADILQTLWDIGYRVGHCLRTVDDCIALGKKDITVRTALMEARFLAGSQKLFNYFRTSFDRKVVLKRPASYIAAKIREREAGYQQYGTTVYLLEPHVKMSQGGLRDLHLFQWASLCHHHTASLEGLKHRGFLSSMDYKALTGAREFLWKIRNELHFEAGHCQDLLTFEEQVRLSRLWGFEDTEHLLGVEQFMREYYEQTTALFDITRRLVDSMAKRPFTKYIGRYLKRQTINGHFIIEGNEISISQTGRSSVLEDTCELLKLFYLSGTHNVRLSFEAYTLIKNAMKTSVFIPKMDGKAASIFLQILGGPGGVAGVLREMHHLRLLEQIIPEFSHARGLMQFNEYHKYTVDEHCFRSVEEAEESGDQPGIVSRIYREIQKKDILCLALLIHDLGKGFGPDHSSMGIQIAKRTAEHMTLDNQTSSLLVFLVGNHLLMTRIAFRRDLSDEKVLLQFAKTVATPEVLKMLYVLTVADVAAVGPGTLTAWKRDLLTELFEKTLEILTGEKVEAAEDDRAGKVVEWVLAHCIEMDRSWISQQLSLSTKRYLLSIDPERIVRHLGKIMHIPSEHVVVEGEYDSAIHATEYTVYTLDDQTPGIFYKIAGVMAAKGLQILGANIITWENKVVVDTFWVQDPDFAEAPTRARLDEVSSSIHNILVGHGSVDELMAQGRRIQARRRAFPVAIPAKVEVDNASSEQYTIIEVFAQDRQGFLYIIAKTMFDLGLSVHTAKVSTQLDQIVDVFYVTDKSDNKIIEPEDIQKIKERLTAAIPAI